MATKKMAKTAKGPDKKVTPEQAMTPVSANLRDTQIPVPSAMEQELDSKLKACEVVIREFQKHISALETSEAAANRGMLEARRELEETKGRR